MTKVIEYTTTSNDLCRLAQERVGNVMRDVLSLCETPDEAVLVNLTVLMTIGATAAGAFAKHQGVEPDKIPVSELLPELFKAMEGMSK